MSSNRPTDRVSLDAILDEASAYRQAAEQAERLLAARARLVLAAEPPVEIPVDVEALLDVFATTDPPEELSRDRL